MTFEIHYNLMPHVKPWRTAYQSDNPGIYGNWRVDVASLEELEEIVNASTWAITIYGKGTLSSNQQLPIIIID